MRANVSSFQRITTGRRVARYPGVTDLEKDARQIAARLLISAGERCFANSRVFEDLVEMVKEAVRQQRSWYLDPASRN